ncbi:unnamed protein product [Chrysoparadoxa australica]
MAPSKDKSSSSSNPPTHQTVPYAPKPQTPPKLQSLCLSCIAANSEALVDLSGLDFGVTIAILQEVMRRQKLTVPLVEVFRESGHDEITRALAGLDLVNGVVPTATNGCGNLF